MKSLKPILNSLMLVTPFMVFCQVSSISYKPAISTVLDTSMCRVFVTQSPRPLPKVSGYWAVEEKDLLKLQKNFTEILSLPATGPNMEGVILPLSLDNYGYQFMGVIINRKKYIYVNAFYLSEIIPIEDYKNWESEPVTWRTGGYSYWGALFSVRKQEFSNLTYNNH